MNPFDLKAILMERHAQHVVLIHFPIALFITGAVLDFAARWTKRAGLREAANINLMLAAAAVIPTAATGLVAWQWALEGQRIHGILLLHMLFGLASTLVIVAVALLHYPSRKSLVGSSKLLLSLEAAGIALVTLTGHLGGFLSGVNS